MRDSISPKKLIHESQLLNACQREGCQKTYVISHSLPDNVLSKFPIVHDWIGCLELSITLIHFTRLIFYHVDIPYDRSTDHSEAWMLSDMQIERRLTFTFKLNLKASMLKIIHRFDKKRPFNLEWFILINFDINLLRMYQKFSDESCFFVQEDNCIY